MDTHLAREVVYLHGFGWRFSPPRISELCQKGHSPAALSSSRGQVIRGAGEDVRRLQGFIWSPGPVGGDAGERGVEENLSKR